jgi:RHS repeat-associated protein
MGICCQKSRKKLYKTCIYFALENHTTGSVLERYEYNANSEPNIMDASYNPRSSSNYGNNYLFTGRRVDILDNGSLKIQYNRNRYYSYNMGRWLTCDSLGVTPNANESNPFSITTQYTDTLNLYEYVRSSPVTDIDSFGLFLIEPPKPCGYFTIDTKSSVYSIKRKALKKFGCWAVRPFLVKAFVNLMKGKYEKHIYKEKKCENPKCYCKNTMGGKCHSIDIYPKGSKKIWDCLVTVTLKVNIKTCFGAGICSGL